MLSQEQIKKTLYNPMKELGLFEQEIKLYALSLALGPVSIAQLAEHMAISRPNVYKVIDSLEKHGLVLFSQYKGHKKTFIVEPPTKIAELLRNKKESINKLDFDITNLMPQLLALYRQGELPSSIKIFEGKSQFKKLFDESLNETKDTAEFFGSTEDFITFISWADETEWIKRRIKKEIKINVLSLPSKTAETLKAKDKQELRETKILKMPIPFNTSFQVYANKVIIWQPKTPLAILISDEYIVQMLRSIFYSLWKISK